MSDSCDFTKPAAHGNEMDRGLAAYRDSHRAVARYTLILKDNFTAKAPFKVIKEGLSFIVADNECKRLNAARPETGFGVSVYSITLENPEEARLAVKMAADKYWAGLRPGVYQPLAA